MQLDSLSTGALPAGRLPLIRACTGFRWLKGSGAVAPVFLNTPTRIRALGLILILALMVRNHPQFSLRAAMVARGLGVQHPTRRKPDQKLTTEMALEWFSGIQIVFVRMPRTDWTRTTPELCLEAHDILALLGIKADIYARPPPR